MRRISSVIEISQTNSAFNVFTAVTYVDIRDTSDLEILVLRDNSGTRDRTNHRDEFLQDTSDTSIASDVVLLFSLHI